MAITIPSKPHLLTLSGANSLRAELATLFEKGLSNEYYVFHRPNAVGVLPDDSEFGAFDFLILGTTGALLAIVIVDSEFTQNETGVTTHRNKQDERPARLANRALRWIKHAVAQDSNEASQIQADYLLYFPRHKIGDDARHAIGAEHIIDQSQREDLISSIRSRLDVPGNQGRMPVDIQFRRQRLMERLNGIVSVHSDRPTAEDYVLRQHDPLHFLNSLHIKPMRIRLRAAAGAGKTTFGVQRFMASVNNKQRALFISTDSQLTSRLNTRGSGLGKAYAWFEFVGRFLDDIGFPRPNFSQVGSDSAFWEELAEEIFESAVPQNWRFDTIIVENGHLFRKPWWAFLRGFIGPDSEVVWLEDIRLSQTEPCHPELNRYVSFNIDTTQRTPWRIARFIHDVTGQPLCTTNPLPGRPVCVRGYRNPAEQIDIVIREVAKLQREGFTHDDIVIVTLGDLKDSALSKTDHIGDAKLRRPNEARIDKSILFTSLDSFLGREAAAVVLIDVNSGISVKDAHADHLYQAATRATVSLCVVALMGNPLTKVLLDYDDCPSV